MGVPQIARQPDVVAFVAPNGLGHFRRQVGILSRLLERVPLLRVRIICAEAQVAATRDWERAVRFFADPRVDQVGGIMDPGVAWSTAATRYDDGSLLRWVDRLAGVPDLPRAKLVISDNLAAVLSIRSDAILAGSFLWCDVLSRAHPDSHAVRAFADLEARLLRAHRPPMLCVRDIVMPAVLESTQAVPVGWMCETESVRSTRGRVPRVGLLGGATGAAETLLARAGRALAHTSAFELTGGDAFGHGAADFAALDVAVCRPGVGTVSDCVAQGVPMVTLHEGRTNPEMMHIGERLAALGVAINLGAEPDDAAIVAAVRRAAEPKTAATIRSRLGALPRNGLAEAVDFLVARLNGDAV